MTMREQLLLKNQLCFPLYAASKAVTRLYAPYLAPYRLTYTQYIALLVLFEHDGLTVKELGKAMHLDSGTLSPLLEKLETRGFVKKEEGEDKREKRLFLTIQGKAMEDRLASIPEKIGTCLRLNQEEAVLLYELSYRLLDQLEENHE